MIKVNYGAIPDALFANYLNYLINQLYKSLCLKEENNHTLISYLESLRNELIGSKELIVFLKNDARFISLLSKIQFLISSPDVDHKTFKKEIFSSISIVKKLQEKYLDNKRR